MAEDWSAIPEWIDKADGDWAMLRLAQSQPGLEDGVAFHPHQCVEKLLKACLIQQGESFRKIHDLVALSRQLHAADVTWN
jgi:HEPN domain-containing protein